MNIVEILKRDEGVVYEIYLDHLGYPTFGIGHLITEDDPEYGMPIGTLISEERVMEAFDQDLNDVEIDVARMFPHYSTYPHEVNLVLFSMMFQLGYSRLSKFKRFRHAINLRDWQTAAYEMLDSKWAKQTPNRVARLVELMKNASNS